MFSMIIYTFNTFYVNFVFYVKLYFFLGNYQRVGIGIVSFYVRDVGWVG